jgi:hypothetical protein
MRAVSWHRTHGACGVIDTACMVHAVSLIPDSQMHTVSLTPHARCMLCHLHRMHGACGVIDTACTIQFLEKWKSYAKRRWYAKKIKIGYGVIDTACKIWHRMHYRRTIRTALAAFKGNVYQKHSKRIQKGGFFISTRIRHYWHYSEIKLKWASSSCHVYVQCRCWFVWTFIECPFSFTDNSVPHNFHLINWHKFMINNFKQVLKFVWVLQL